jgi:DNA-binding transcriptional ArsR family regulator
MNMMYTDEQLQLARFARAMGNPARIKILEILLKQSCCYSGNIVNELPIAPSTLSQHLKELKKAGLIHGEIKPPRIRYCIHQENWNLAKKLFEKYLNLSPDSDKLSCSK